MSDPREFETFMRAYQNMVYTTAVRLLGSPTDALDMAQEVFLKAYERFEELQQHPAVGGWLKRVATNLCLNHLTRYRARWRFFSELFAPDQPEDLENLLGVETAPSQDTGRSHELECALQRLPAAQRVPLVLYHFEEMSYEEIARRLRISLSKVKTDIHRGRQALRRWLRPGLADSDSGPKAQAGEAGSDQPWSGHFRLAGNLLAVGWGHFGRGGLP